MHDVKLPQHLVDRIKNRRGHLHAFETIDPATTALVVIDMQDAFVAAGAPLEVPKARDVVANINRLAEAMRGAGGAVVWVKMTMAESGPNSFPVYYQHFFQEEGRKKHLAALTEGAEHHRIYPELDVKPDDPVVLKNRFSALIQGSSELDALCQARGIDTLIVVGTLTNVCCESTVRDAMMLGYRALMPADASATLSDEEHLAALITVALFFGDIRDTEIVLRLIKQGTGVAKTRAAELAGTLIAP